jgi:hypothetical protein
MWADRALGIALGLVIGVGAVVAFVFLGSQQTIDEPGIEGGGERTTTTAPQPPGKAPVVRIVGGAPPSAGPVDLRFKRGDRVRFKAVSDAAVVLEVDRYGVSRDVPANEPIVITFPAKKAGEFAVINSANHIAVARLIVSG